MVSKNPSIFKWVFPKIRDTPKWIVKIMENPIKDGMIWGKPTIRGNTQMDPGMKVIGEIMYPKEPSLRWKPRSSHAATGWLCLSDWLTDSSCWGGMMGVVGFGREINLLKIIASRRFWKVWEIRVIYLSHLPITMPPNPNQMNLTHFYHFVFLLQWV